MQETPGQRGYSPDIGPIVVCACGKHVASMLRSGKPGKRAWPLYDLNRAFRWMPNVGEHSGVIENPPVTELCKKEVSA